MINLQNLISLVLVKESSSNGMAVPKSRRSKAKGRTRLSNWKRKGSDAAKKAFSAAKRVLAKEKKPEAPIEKDERDEKIIELGEVSVIEPDENTDTSK